MIKVNNIYKSFGNVEVLKGVDLTIEKGKVASKPDRKSVV